MMFYQPEAKVDDKQRSVLDFFASSRAVRRFAQPDQCNEVAKFD